LFQNFVEEKDKDDIYWAKRIKNNVAARRSREARRLKENQIALRAAFLERENAELKQRLEKLVEEEALAASETANINRRLKEVQR